MGQIPLLSACLAPARMPAVSAHPPLLTSSASCRCSAAFRNHPAFTRTSPPANWGIRPSFASWPSREQVAENGVSIKGTVLCTSNLGSALSDSRSRCEEFRGSHYLSHAADLFGRARQRSESSERALFSRGSDRCTPRRKGALRRATASVHRSTAWSRITASGRAGPGHCPAWEGEQKHVG